MKLVIVVGTRPEIIKMSPILRGCQDRRMDFRLIHTGQHFSYEMERIFFQELALPEAHYRLDVGPGSHGIQTGKILAKVEEVLLQEKPNLVLVEGDTNTVLAAGLAAVKLHIPVGHVEAGLRSGDGNMPEEINRLLTDHLSHYLFAPTEGARENLKREGVEEDKILVTGNTIVDAVYLALSLAQGRSRVREQYGLSPRSYFLITSHRQENVDVRHRLQGILEGLALVYREWAQPILFPVHPRTQSKLREFQLTLPHGVMATPPLGFLDFLELEASARIIFTDSGGVQEEACILQVPCVTLRDNTERPETLAVGANILAGTEPLLILEAARQALGKENSWVNPFGDGHAGERILNFAGTRFP